MYTPRWLGSNLLRDDLYISMDYDSISFGNVIVTDHLCSQGVVLPLRDSCIRPGNLLMMCKFKLFSSRLDGGDLCSSTPVVATIQISLGGRFPFEQKKQFAFQCPVAKWNAMYRPCK